MVVKPCSECGSKDVIPSNLGMHDQSMPPRCIDAVLKGSKACDIVRCAQCGCTRVIHAGEWE